MSFFGLALASNLFIYISPQVWPFLMDLRCLCKQWFSFPSMSATNTRHSGNGWQTLAKNFSHFSKQTKKTQNFYLAAAVAVKIQIQAMKIKCSVWNSRYSKWPVSYFYDKEQVKQYFTNTNYQPLGLSQSEHLIKNSKVKGKVNKNWEKMELSK